MRKSTAGRLCYVPIWPIAVKVHCSGCVGWTDQLMMNTQIVLLSLVKMCDLSLSVAQERWRPLLQLNSSSHPLLREARSAHSSRIQYPSPCQHTEEAFFSPLVISMDLLFVTIVFG